MEYLVQNQAFAPAKLDIRAKNVMIVSHGTINQGIHAKVSHI